MSYPLYKPDKSRAGQPYMPSNGTEGMVFTAAWCDTCIHQHPNPEKKPQCVDVQLKSMIGEQPPEWIYNHDGKPICTKYKHWDWGYDDDDDDYNEPPGDVPVGPNQLCMPFDLLDILGPMYSDIKVTKIAIYE